MRTVETNSTSFCCFFSLRMQSEQAVLTQRHTRSKHRQRPWSRAVQHRHVTAFYYHVKLVSMQRDRSCWRYRADSEWGTEQIQAWDSMHISVTRTLSILPAFTLNWQVSSCLHESTVREMLWVSGGFTFLQGKKVGHSSWHISIFQSDS